MLVINAMDRFCKNTGERAFVEKGDAEGACCSECSKYLGNITEHIQNSFEEHTVESKGDLPNYPSHRVSQDEMRALYSD